MRRCAVLAVVPLAFVIAGCSGGSDAGSSSSPPGGSSSASASSSASTGAHAAGSTEPPLVEVPGFGYADLTAAEEKQFGAGGPGNGWQKISSHRVTGAPGRLILVEMVPTAAMAADKNAMAVAADMAGAVMTAPEVDTVVTEKIGDQTLRHSHFTLSGGDRMYSISFLRDGTVYWMLCDADTSCTTYTKALVAALAA